MLAPASIARCEPTGPAAWATRTDVLDFRASQETPAELERQLRLAITEAVGPLADAEGWMSPLSGGVDSRALLLFWRGALPPTVTWGTESALRDDTSDAVVAARVAERLGTSNRYVVVEPTSIETDEVLRRFRDVCEGRIDHFGGYADGFAVFDSLHASGVRAIVRGDEAFGWSRSLSEEDLYRSLALSFGVRVRGLPPALEALVADRQLPPRRSGGRASRSPAGDRLYAGVRAPTVLAALNACKAPWVDIANPFLHREVVEVVRRLPDRLRTDKALFKRIVGSMGIDVPYARTATIATPRDVLSSPASRALLGDDRALAPSWLGDEATDGSPAGEPREGKPKGAARGWRACDAPSALMEGAGASDRRYAARPGTAVGPARVARGVDTRRPPRGRRARPAPGLSRWSVRAPRGVAPELERGAEALEDRERVGAQAVRADHAEVWPESAVAVPTVEACLAGDIVRAVVVAHDEVYGAVEVEVKRASRRRAPERLAAALLARVSRVEVDRHERSFVKGAVAKPEVGPRLTRAAVVIEADHQVADTVVVEVGEEHGFAGAWFDDALCVKRSAGSAKVPSPLPKSV